MLNHLQKRIGCCIRQKSQIKLNDRISTDFNIMWFNSNRFKFIVYVQSKCHTEIQESIEKERE